MPEETYHGHRIAYSKPPPMAEAAQADQEAAEAARAEEAAGPTLQIDDREYEVIVHSDGSYSAREYYFEKFGSLAALGRALARGLPD
jgi:hypothetical protein